MGLTKEELAKKIKETREKLKLTQEEVAKKAGMKANYYAVIERGEVDPGAEKLIKIFESLGIELSFP